MRVSLPVTLFASLIFHVGAVAAFALSLMHNGSTPVTLASQSKDTPTVMLLRSEEAPLARGRSTNAAAPLPAARSIASATSIPPAVVKALSAASPPPALALEANPNAHVRPVVPDAILCPNPAPPLDSASAVVFILDISGSMYEPYAGTTRIALGRENLSRQIRALKDGTPFAVALYALSACRSGPLVAASDATREAAVRFLMHDVDCGGGTNLPAGLASAQELHPGSLVLVTDGDLNAPAYVLAAKTRELLGPDGRCPSLGIVGIAPRGSQHAERLLRELAEQQGGTYASAQFDGNGELVTSAAPVIKAASATR